MSFATHLSAATVALVLNISAAGAADQNTAAGPGEFSILHQARAVPLTADELATVRGSYWAVRVWFDTHSIVSIVPGKGPAGGSFWTTSVYEGLSGIEVGPLMAGGRH